MKRCTLYSEAGIDTDQERTSFVLFWNLQQIDLIHTCERKKRDVFLSLGNVSLINRHIIYNVLFRTSVFVMYSHVKSYTLQAREHPIRKNNFLLKGCLKCEWTLISIVHILINPSFSCLFLVSIIKFMRYSSNMYFRRHSISYGSQHFINCPLWSPWPISHRQ